MKLRTPRARAAALSLGALLVGAGAGFVGGWFAHAARSPVPTLSVRTEDRNADGKPDRWIERDATGAITNVREDNNYDGFAERTSIYVGGKVNRIDYDSDGDRRYDTTDQLGGDGRVLSVMYDRNWNTIPERWVEFNARGTISAEWIDENEDSAPERYRSFDPAGRITDEGINRDGDRLYETTRTFHPVWGTGQPQRVEHDDDRDGVYERRENYTRTGLLRSVNDDPEHDGTRDHLSLFASDGTLRKEGFDRDGDGFYDEWHFPVPGAPARIGYDDDGDYDIDRWAPPGAPPGWLERHCNVHTSHDAGVPRDARIVR